MAPDLAEPTEHGAPEVCCPGCGKISRAELPREVMGNHFGPRLVTIRALMVSCVRMSRRDLDRFFADLMDIRASSLRTTQPFANEAAPAVPPGYREVRRAVRRSERAGVYETRWKLRGVPLEQV